MWKKSFRLALELPLKPPRSQPLELRKADRIITSRRQALPQKPPKMDRVWSRGPKHAWKEKPWFDRSVLGIYQQAASKWLQHKKIMIRIDKTDADSKSSRCFYWPPQVFLESWPSTSWLRPGILLQNPTCWHLIAPSFKRLANFFPIKTTPFAKGVPWLFSFQKCKKLGLNPWTSIDYIYRLGNVSTSASKALIWEAKTIYAPPTISRRFWLLKIGCEKKHVKSMKQQVEAWSIQPTVQQPQVSYLSVFQCPLQHDIHAFHSGMLLFRLFYLALLSHLSFI